MRTITNLSRLTSSFGEEINLLDDGTFYFSGSSAIRIPSGDAASRPSSPTMGSLRLNTDLNQLEYYTGSIWDSAAPGSSVAGKVDKAGDTMAGALILHANPSDPLGAATKQYVDSKSLSLETDINNIYTTYATTAYVDNAPIATVSLSAPGFPNIGDLWLNSGTNELSVWDGSVWILAAGGGSGASVTISDTAPVSPSSGDLWWDSTTAVLKIYYDDGATSQWVDATPIPDFAVPFQSVAPVSPSIGDFWYDSANSSLKIYNGSIWIVAGGGGGASVTVSSTAPGTPDEGDLWWDTDDGTLKVYYNDGATSQWVDASPIPDLAIPVQSTEPVNPVHGDLWYDTNNTVLKIYFDDGVSPSWINSTGVSKSVFEFTASGGETSLSGLDDNSNTLSYNTGAVEVYLNGIQLTDADYSATTGSSITGLAALSPSDIVRVVTYDSLGINTFNKTAYEYTATAGQTVFTGPDDNSRTLLFVGDWFETFINGVRIPESDYSTSGGDTITFNSGVTLNDNVVFVVYTPYVAADAISKSGGSMTGLLELSGDPVTNLGAATKQYVDNSFVEKGSAVPAGQGTVKGVLVVSGGNVAIDLSLSQAFDLSVTSDFTLSNPTPPAGSTGGTWYIDITTDSSSRSITLDTEYSLQSGVLFLNPTTVNRLWIIQRSGSEYDVYQEELV